MDFKYLSYGADKSQAERAARSVWRMPTDLDQVVDQLRNSAAVQYKTQTACAEFLRQLWSMEGSEYSGVRIRGSNGSVSAVRYIAGKGLLPRIRKKRGALIFLPFSFSDLVQSGWVAHNALLRKKGKPNVVIDQFSPEGRDHIGLVTPRGGADPMDFDGFTTAQLGHKWLLRSPRKVADISVSAEAALDHLTAMESYREFLESCWGSTLTIDGYEDPRAIASRIIEITQLRIHQPTPGGPDISHALTSRARSLAPSTFENDPNQPFNLVNERLMRVRGTATLTFHVNWDSVEAASEILRYTPRLPTPIVEYMNQAADA